MTSIAGFPHECPPGSCRPTSVSDSKIPDSATFRALLQVQSFHEAEAGPKLVVRCRGNVIVARGGASPLAWSRRDSPPGKDSGSRCWQPVRPAIDAILRPPAVLQDLYHQ